MRRERDRAASGRSPSGKEHDAADSPECASAQTADTLWREIPAFGHRWPLSTQTQFLVGVWFASRAPLLRATA